MPDNGSDDTASEHKGRSYTLTVGNNSYNEDCISDPVYTAAAPNHGMYGIASACFSCDIFTGAGNEGVILGLTPCSPVVFSEINNAEFILTGVSFRSKGVVSITAYTQLVNSDIIMKAETFPEKNSEGDLLTYPCSEVAGGALSEVLGTGGIPAGISGEPRLFVSEFKGKSVRQVLEEISKVNGGYFSDTHGIRFCAIGEEPQGGMQLTADQHSAVAPGTVKKISRVFVTDSEDNAVYDIGSGEYYCTETLSGSFLIGEAVCTAAASKIIGDYTGWHCDSILADDFVPVLHTKISFGDLVMTAENISIKYTKNHSVMSAGADSFSMAFADYSDQKQRAIDSKVTTGKTYSNSGFDSQYGFYFTYPKGSDK